MANAELLVRTLHHIDGNRADWSQVSLRRCFAAHAAILAGGEWATPPTSNLPFLLVPTEDDPAADVRNYGGHGGSLRAINVTRRAARVLDLDPQQANRLFLATNSLERLHIIVSDLCEVAA